MQLLQIATLSFAWINPYMTDESCKELAIRKQISHLMPMPVTASPIDIILFLIVSLLFLGVIAFLLLRAFRYVVVQNTHKKTDIYARQLRELELDLDEGRIEESEFSGAKAEILKRILRAENNVDAQLRPTKFDAKLPLLTIALVVFVTIGTYFFVGNPFLKDQPISAREKELMSRPPESLSQNEIMLVLQSRAQKDPKDAMPHLFMGKILMGEGRTNDALHAFQAALRRDGKNAEIFAEIGGAFLELSNFQIDNEFKTAIAASLKIDPQNLSAQFYQGLALWKNDQKPMAIAQWEQAWAKLPKDDGRKSALLFRIIDELSKLDKGPNSAGGSMMSGGMGGPMSGENPQEFINSMIEQRRTKLAASPDDLGLRLSLAKVLVKTNPTDASKLLDEGKKYQTTEFGREILNLAIAMQTSAGRAN